MSLRVDYSVLNQRETPSLFADVFSNRPAFGFNGRLFISIDTKQIFRDYGTNWELIADAGSGSSNLQQVCTNGNFTTTDIDMLSGNLILRNLNPGGVLFTNTSEIVSQDINNFFWDDTNNRLGIGTNTPTAPLDVHSTGNILQQLNGTSTNNTYLAFLNQDIGKWRIGNYYNSGDNDFVIYDTFSGVTRAFFTNTGYTILPTNLIIGSSNRSSAYGMDVYVSANYQSTLRVQGATTLLSQINGTFAVFSGDLTIATNKFFVNSSTGNIGMGTITPEANSNNTTLQIDGTNSSFVRTGTSAYGGYFATIPTADVLVLSNVRNPVTGTFSNINKACSQMSLWGESGNGYITFSTSPTNNGAPVERLRITSGGNVGIGTSSPAYPLEITKSSGDVYLNILRASKSTGQVALRLAGGTGGTNWVIYQDGNADDLQFFGNGAERMRITSGGDVLVGTTSDTFYNGSNAGIGLFGANTFIAASRSSATCAFFNRFTTTGDIVQIRYAGSNVGSISYNGINTLYNATSDYRLKEDLKDYNGLDIINQLKTYNFKWKEAGIRDYGMMAHELQEILPNYVNGQRDAIDEDGKIKPQGVDYSKIVPILVKAIQELHAKLN